nr:phage tail protein [uncultured Mucilaginibacter sp.]
MQDIPKTNSATVTATINLLPVGTIMPFAGNTDKIAKLSGQGWMLCNGARLNKIQYPDLFDVIGHSCGGDDPNFCLPDLRGMFLRGVDGADTDSHDPDNGSRTRQGSTTIVPNGVLTRQEDELRKHAHNFPQRAHYDSVFQTNGSGGYYFANIAPIEGTTHETPGKETRPKNVSVNYIIFAGLPKS